MSYFFRKEQVAGSTQEAPDQLRNALHVDVVVPGRINGLNFPELRSVGQTEKRPLCNRLFTQAVEEFIGLYGL
jgi:hypothetical protein